MNKYAKIGVIFSIILFILYNLYSIFGDTRKFYIGSHNVDLSYNMCNLENMFNTTLIDLNSQGVNWTKDEMYTYGFMQIKTGFNGVFIGLIGVFIGIYALRLIREVEKNE